MRMRVRLLPILCLLPVACGAPGEAVVAPDVDSLSPADVTVDGTMEWKGTEDAGMDRYQPADLLDLSFLDEGIEPGCAPGEGCFLDKCSENGDCQSGWCVDHMGEGVCTIPCTEECPQGWSCQQVAGTAPDIVYLCVSDFANLCRPCGGNPDCKSVGGAEDVCIDYGSEGSFCGGGCLVDEDCPWGFSCAEATTVDGIATKQCVSDAGLCPCTEKSVALALWTPCEASNEWGSCSGKRVCTEEGLSACDAVVAAAELCNGLDDDCDGETDEPDLVDGKYVSLCDDGNPCTNDACEGETGCSHSALQQGECMDGDPCTVADHCEQGVCVGQQVDCDDGNPCTEDWCNPAGGCEHSASSNPCDDGDPCTVNDSCSNGQCQGFAVPCDCQETSDCSALEDDNLCNGTLVCDTSALPYQCVVDPATVVQCAEPPEGPDAICLKPFCDPATGVCALLPDHGGFACEDGDACSVGDVCTDGSCVPGAPANCNDGNPCTEDSCDPVEGCTHAGIDKECNDGNVCTVGDHCVDGLCSAGQETLLCDDENPCTVDACVPESGCSHSPLAGDCDDGNACTVGEQCVAGQCVGTEPLNCSDGNPCTDDSCDPKTGCAYKLNSAPCDDGDICTAGDHCHLGECIHSQVLVCDDSNPCTNDSCDAATGCQFVANNLPCDDNNTCTQGEGCSGGWCTGGLPVSCDDGNLCTDDTCDPAAGCEHESNSAPCTDGNACTLGDICADGSCKPGTEPLDCDDANPCTDDSCNPAAGCIHVDNALPCDDGDACTLGDTCADGSCKPGTEPLDCDDANPCTDDSCNPAAGCIHVDNALPCDDGDACTLGDTCAVGSCKPGTEPLDCDDGAPCTEDSCDPQQGCLHTPLSPCCGNGVKEGTEHCDDGNLVDGDGCSSTCELEASGCVILGQDVRTLEQPPQNYQLGSCQTLCENQQTTIPQGWRIATIQEVAFLKNHVKFGACGVYGVCGSYWYGGDVLTSNCSMLHYNCTTGGCWAYTSHCYTQVMLIKEGKDGTCLQ